MVNVTDFVLLNEVVDPVAGQIERMIAAHDFVAVFVFSVTRTVELATVCPIEKVVELVVEIVDHFVECLVLVTGVYISVDVPVDLVTV